MNLPLSKRLQACCTFVLPGARVADIGCDHGYLGIYLLSRGIADSVFSADINEMPLQSAKRNAAKFGVQDKMHFYLSDGLQNVPQEFDTLVCAGMGADTIISVLEKAPWLQSPRYRLILQCQSKTPMLRQYLSDNGWHIDKETVLRDGRFLYTVMAVCWKPESPRLTAGQRYFPPALLTAPVKELSEYYQDVVFRLRRANSARGENVDPTMRTALLELENDPSLTWLKEINYDNS